MSVAPRPAATVVLLRAGADAPEILMVRRSRGAAFMADAFVFPGGRVEPDDGEGEAGFRRAAVRETLEEAGVVVDESTLVLLSHWVTPSVEPRRFDTRFFLAVATPETTAKVDEREVTEHRWGTAQALLEAGTRGEIKLPPPTLATLVDLAPHATLEAAITWSRDRPVAPIQPKVAMVEGRIAIVLPWDEEFAALEGEGEPIALDHPMLATMAAEIRTGPTRFWLDDGRWKWIAELPPSGS